MQSNHSNTKKQNPWRMVIHCLLCLLLCLVATHCGTATKCEKSVDLKNPFFAFNNSMQDKGIDDPADQAALLRELGYDGIEGDGDDLDIFPKLIQELDKRNLKVFSIYFGVDIDQGERPYDPRIKEYLEKYLKGRDVVITVHLHSKKFKPSDAAGDNFAVPILRKLADMAQPYGVRVAVYHHVYFWAESIDDGVRLAKKVNRPNFGASFNLCHYLQLEGEKNLDERMDKVMPYLFFVSICGADGGPEAKGAGWDKLIQTLDLGSFDNYALLKKLIHRGYKGPIGLQCYNIPGSPREKLSRSMKAWQDMKARFAAEQ